MKLTARAILLCVLLCGASCALPAQEVGVPAATSAGEPGSANAAANQAGQPARSEALTAPTNLSDSSAPAVNTSSSPDFLVPDRPIPDSPASGSTVPGPGPQGGTRANSGGLGNQPADQHFFHDLVHDFVSDEYHIWTGPFHASNYDSYTMKKYGLPFLLISSGLIASDTRTARWLPSDTTAVRFNTRISQIGAPYSLAGLSAAYYLFGRAGHNAHARETGFLALEAVADTQVVAEVIKLATRRQRPTAPDIDLAGFWHSGSSGSSFPSGHTIAAFGVATVFAREYREHRAVPIIAYSLASLVAFSRLGAHQHWYSDVFVGGAAGFLIGRYVYISHHDPDLPGTPVPSRRSRLRPALEAGEQGLGLYWHF
jgi:membrane-associated phospholipid phosphatase